MSELDTTDTTRPDTPTPPPPLEQAEPIGEPKEAPEPKGGETPDTGTKGDASDPEEPEAPDEAGDADAEPTEEGDPAEPGDPTEPAAPEASTASEGDPETEADEADPAEPEQLADPDQPTEPTAQEQPADSDQLGEPENPDEPEQVADPDEPEGRKPPEPLENGEGTEAEEEPDDPIDQDTTEEQGDAEAPEEPTEPRDSTEEESPESPEPTDPEASEASAEDARAPESPEDPDDELPELELELKPYRDSVPYSVLYTASLGTEKQTEAPSKAPELPRQTSSNDEVESATPQELEACEEPEPSDAADGPVDPLDARKQEALANGLIDEAGRVPVEELESGDRVRGWPCDDTGYEIRDEDLQFLGLDEKQVEAWQRFEAPLGMSPEQFKEFKSTLNDALAADGIDPDQVDIRLQGSSAQFFSGSHKDFPTESDLADQPEAQNKLVEWMGDRPESERPARIPFDAKHLLGVEDGNGEAEPPSDYDVQISSSDMVGKARDAWEASDPDTRKPDVIHPKYDFVDKKTVEKAFPALDEWKDHWEQETGREVAPALFTSDGPPDRTGVGTGISTHFRETDWIINRPGGDVDA
ncbi:hypothetical protein ACFY7H_10630 [Streptomyces sp. NPDC012794]|uniref:hypothetical protein n=1 Tax=Streptomyces sp. NPDC012794 TaxID=3364850 RepID=UPI00367D42B9